MAPRSTGALWYVAGGLGLLALAGALLARGKHSDPERCPSGLIATGPHCCGQGQNWDGLRCVGHPSSCSVAQRLEADSCVTARNAIAISGGTLTVAVDDWDLQDRVAAISAQLVEPFAIDQFEVTTEQWAECVARGQCRQLPNVADSRASSAQPVTGVSADDAAGYCAFRAGRLPTSAQWLWAARGAQERRYPWGSFGLVCRRAAFGLVTGPCATEAQGPEMPGSRPDGATPDGVQDLSGNVAEWTRDTPTSAPIARGGSFRSSLASELKSLAAVAESAPAAEIGFRCVYSR